MSASDEVAEDLKMEEEKVRTKVLYMWGYLPGVFPEKSPILTPMTVNPSDPSVSGDSWKDVCGGGCGFAMAISERGKLITWGATDEEGQSFLTSGKHGETPEPFPLPTEDPVVKASAGWAHCVLATESGDLYTWGWKECVPSGKLIADLVPVGSVQKEGQRTQGSLQSEADEPKTNDSAASPDALMNLDTKKAVEEIGKRRKTSPAKQELETSYGDEYFTASPFRVVLGNSVKIMSVAAGGRHTLALSDVGQVWGWGYGGEGQLGLGSRVKMVHSPHHIPCLEPSGRVKDKSILSHEGPGSESCSKIPGSYVKEIACGGRHSAAITDSGMLLTFGWGLYGQCGHGNTADQLRPTCVSSFLGTRVARVTAGLWHTICVTAEGRAYVFGGNQFGQLGTGSEELETSPRLLDTPCLKSRHAAAVSCGARHSAMLTEDGQLFTWGWNKYGQLGLGDSVDRNIPFRVSISGCLPRNVACGWWHTLLLAETPV